MTAHIVYRSESAPAATPATVYKGDKLTAAEIDGNMLSIVTEVATARSESAALSTHAARVDNPHSVIKSQVGLGNVDNTSDANKPVSTAQQTALNLKANIASPTFTGTVSGVTAAMVGLGNVDNTSDATKNAATATLTNKTLTSPVLSNPSYSGTTANGGTVTTIDINGGTIDGTVIGGSSAAAGSFTTLSASDNITVAKATGYARVVITASTGTNEAYFTAINSGGGYHFGAENSAGSWFGATPYAMAFNAPLGKNIESLINGTKITTVSSTGLSVNGTLSASGNVTLGDASTDTVTIPGSLSVGSLNGGPLAGFRNRIINGGFDVWQRGTSIVSSTGIYTADRWRSYSLTAHPTLSQDTSTLDYPCLLITGIASNAGVNIGQGIESANVASLTGTPVTVTYEIYSSAARTVGISTYTFNSKDSGISGMTVGATNAAILTTAVNTWQTVSYTYTPPANAKNGVYIDMLIGNVTAGQTVRIRNVRYEPGSVATPFESRPIGTELSLCQRYLPAFTYSASETVGTGVFFSSTSANLAIQLPVTARVKPTGAVVSNTAFTCVTGGAAPTTTAVAYTAASTNTVELGLTVSGTQGQALLARANGAQTVLFTGCEL